MRGHISVETHAEKYVLSIYTFKKIRSKSKNRGKNNDNSYSLSNTVNYKKIFDQRLFS